MALSLVAGISAAAISVPEIAAAQISGGLVTCSGLECNGCTLISMVNNIVNWLIGFFAIVAACLLAWAGVKLTTSGGNEQELEKSKSMFTNVVIGLVIILAAWMFVNVFMQALTGQGLSFWTKISCGGMVEPRETGPLAFDDSVVDYIEDLRDKYNKNAAAGDFGGYGGGENLNAGGKSIKTRDGAFNVAACDKSQLVTIPFLGHTITTNRAIAPSLNRINQKWIAEGGNSFYKVNTIYSYQCRNATGKSNLSNHAYGIAIDVNGYANPYGKKFITDMPTKFVKIWKEECFGWGGDWKSIKDAMHFSMSSGEGGGCK